MAKPNFYYLRTLTALALIAAAVLSALLMMTSSAPASAQEGGSSLVNYTSPSENQTQVPQNTNVYVWFIGPMDPTSINTGTFTLTKQGTTTPVPATVTYQESYYIGEGGTPIYSYLATLDPQADLETNAIYTATVKGGENGVTPKMSGDYSWSFTTGTSMPDTIIDSGPSGTVGSSPATFSFHSNVSGSTFECSLDGAAFTSCTSPQSYTGLSDGEHTFSVRAIDPAGNIDPTPATRTWTVSTYSQTVDNTDSSRFSAKSGVWRTGSSSQAYGSDYRYTPPKSWSYYAYYKISTPTAGKYKVYAWWPAFSSNNSSTAFWIWTTSGWAQKNVDQRTNGGQWYPLGEYDMNAGEGWNIEVDFGHYSASTGNIVADAVKIERQ